jgi:hypothetical protein
MGGVSKLPPPIGKRALIYLRRQLKRTPEEMDRALQLPQLPPGDFARAEAGEILLDQVAVMRIRQMNIAAVDAGLIDLKMHVGETIRHLRIEHGISQKKLAELCNCGWDQPRISQIEKCPNIGRRNVMIIANALGEPIEKFYSASPLTAERIERYNI